MPVFPPRRRATSDPYRDQQLLTPGPYVPQPVYPVVVPQGVSPHFAPVPLSPGHPYYAWAPQAPGYPSPQYWPAEVPVEASYAIQLHPLLAQTQLRLLYDCRFKPEKSYISSSSRPPYRMPDEVAKSPATNPMVTKIRLISKALPWTVTVKSDDGVSVGEILQAVYDALDQPLTEGEWWIAPESERARVLESYKRNCSDADGAPKKRKLEDGVKRVDWLGKKTMIVGIARPAPDDPLVKSRIPNKSSQPEAWVLELADAS